MLVVLNGFNGEVLSSAHSQKVTSYFLVSVKRVVLSLTLAKLHGLSYLAHGCYSIFFKEAMSLVTL